MKPKAPAAAKLSLFDEDEEEEEDLFGGGAKPVKAEKATPPSQVGGP